MIQNIFKKEKILVESEDLKIIKFEGLIFRYKIDGKLNINNKEIIVEIKTVYAAGFYSIENEPKSEHLLQLICYMLFENIDTGVLLYIGRDNGRMIEYIINKDDILFNKAFLFIINKCKELIKLKNDIENKRFPERDFSIVIKNKDGISFTFTKDKIKYKSCWQCEYCQWKNLCWQKEIKEIEKHNFYINGKFE